MKFEVKIQLLNLIIFCAIKVYNEKHEVHMSF